MVNCYLEAVNTARRHILDVCNRNPKFRAMSKDRQLEIESEMLTKLFLRKILLNKPFNDAYIRTILNYEFRQSTYSAPFIRKERKKFEDREKWGINHPEIGSTFRASNPDSLDDLLALEAHELQQQRLLIVTRAIDSLAPKQRKVLQKFLSGDSLSVPERNVKFRAIKALRKLLTQF